MGALQGFFAAVDASNALGLKSDKQAAARVLLSDGAVARRKVRDFVQGRIDRLTADSLRICRDADAYRKPARRVLIFAFWESVVAGTQANACRWSAPLSLGCSFGSRRTPPERPGSFARPKGRAFSFPPASGRKRGVDGRRREGADRRESEPLVEMLGPVVGVWDHIGECVSALD